MESNIGLFLTKRARLSPNLEGWVDVATERRYSFAELNARCNRTANALASLGVKKGDRVALLLMNSVEFCESFFAIGKLGAVCVPLNWRLVPDELAFILKDSGSTHLIYGEEFSGMNLKAVTFNCRCAVIADGGGKEMILNVRVRNASL